MRVPRGLRAFFAKMRSKGMKDTSAFSKRSLRKLKPSMMTNLKYWGPRYYDKYAAEKVDKYVKPPARVVATAARVAKRTVAEEVKKKPFLSGAIAGTATGGGVVYAQQRRKRKKSMTEAFHTGAMIGMEVERNRVRRV